MNYINQQTSNIESGQYKLHVTGHSLGASYGTLCFGQLLNLNSANPPKSWVLGDFYTFGSPRISENDFAKPFASTLAGQIGSAWRIVNRKDPVPTVPPAKFLFWSDPRIYIHVDSGIQIFPHKNPKALGSELGMDPGPEAPSDWSIIWNASDHCKSICSFDGSFTHSVVVCYIDTTSYWPSILHAASTA
jgi:hypothetical protein